jgi:hypothetical protein
MKKRIIAPLLLCCLFSTAWADTLQLQENHPDRYVVVKGDTLWDISARFLKDPWLWPKVWKMNREQIKNPHLIYPGDVVVLDLSGGEPQLRLLRETVKLQPGVRVEELEKKAIPTIAPSVIGPFLSQPLLVENDILKDSPTIVGAEDKRLLIAPGMQVYVNKIEEGEDTSWQIYRPGKPLTDQDTKELLGTEAVYLGDARVAKFGTPATVHIKRIKQDINIGDKLIKPVDVVLNAFVPHAPDDEIRGRILSTYEGGGNVGRNSIVAVNRGASDGLEEGHVLAVYRDGATLPPTKEEGVKKEGYFNLERNEDGSLKRDDDGKVQVRLGTKRLDGKTDPEAIKLPDERVGLLMVFRTFERVSYALVMQSSREINVSDVVTTP